MFQFALRLPWIRVICKPEILKGCATMSLMQKSVATYTAACVLLIVKE